MIRLANFTVPSPVASMSVGRAARLLAVAALSASIGIASQGALAAPSRAAATSTSNTTIGSQSHGAGAGKVTFNPFSITRS